MTTERLRVVQWTTGNTGRVAVRAIADHPVLDLVGCYAYSPDKVGVDVGELCGLPPLGIEASNDIEALLALRPDCVSYMPYRPDTDHVIRLLESGINIVTTMYMLSGSGYGEDVATAIRDAAVRGGASLYSSGVYPGQVAMIALGASAMCRRIDRISVLESLDISGYANERMFRAQGYDLLPDDPQASVMAEASCGSFKDQVLTLGSALGASVDRVEFSAEFATADHTTDLGFMVVREGHIAGMKGTVAGIVDGRSAIECRFVWMLGDQMTPNWPLTRGYVIEIEGDPDVRVKVESPSGHLDGATTTALPCVNAIPQVCEAPPGIVNQMSLPFVRADRAIRRG